LAEKADGGSRQKLMILLILKMFGWLFWEMAMENVEVHINVTSI